MKFKKILITGGAGFVGANLAIKFKDYFPGIEVSALDNLYRRGSELNLVRLKKSGIKFIYGDVRQKEDLRMPEFDLLIECSAEPSVAAGIYSTPEYVLSTNLVGAMNCFEAARERRAAVFFISTSRVYPIKYLNNLNIVEKEKRFELQKNQQITGASENGIDESFPLDAPRTFYGATKLSAELLLQEYVENYGLRGLINRCGIIAGPWQWGKVDQGVITHWMVSHLLHKPLRYLSFGGQGKQVRDVLHIDDFFSLMVIELEQINKLKGLVFNVGGGLDNSISLRELTDLCQSFTKSKVEISKSDENKIGDIKLYISNCSKIKKMTGWKVQKNVRVILEDTYRWLVENRQILQSM